LKPIVKGEIRMKYSVFTVMTPDWELAQVPQNLAEPGYDGVEWRVLPAVDHEEGRQRFPNGVPRQARYWMDNQATLELERVVELAPELKRITEAAGLAFCSLATYLFTYDFDQIERVMQAAQIMGCPRLRVRTPAYDRSRNFNLLFDEATAQLGRVEQLARKYGVEANIETHMGHITSSASLAHRLVSQFDPQFIGVIYDPGNMVTEGNECFRMGLELLGPYLHEVHGKNAAWVPGEADAEDGTVPWQTLPSPMHQGCANWLQVMRDLKAVSYQGWISFEDFSDVDDESTREKCARNLAYLQELERRADTGEGEGTSTSWPL
jgi:sugar phosphate isomerase/epimerase